MPNSPANLLLGKYRVVALVGRGAFGEVYHVTHSKLKASRAVKVLRRDAQVANSQMS